jgi:WD40 repeat protein/DNA-binding SARP family transcriptional activator
VDIALLGPLKVGGDAALGPRDRVVLAALALHPGEVVNAERLADALWGERPPVSWPKVVQGCVMRLRKELGAPAIETTRQGYRLAIPADDVDAQRFERLVVRTRELLTLGEPERAAYVAGQALALWRGRALVELEGWDPGRIEAERLEELRRDAEELRLDADLRAGRHGEVLAEAQARVAEAPLRERRWALLALAQYQTGRQGEALRSLQGARTVLASDLGLDPGPDLVALEAAILRQDPSLAAEAALPEPSTTCPYLGLVPYDVADSDAFFGRDADVAACLQRLASVGVLAVVGPSGSGKSSLVRAGVAAALGCGGRRVAVVTPGAHPMDALTALPGEGTVPVLVVDQCEEAVTLCDDPDERARFLAALAAHAQRGLLVVALRADRLGELSAHPGFARLIEPGLYLLGVMGDADLHAAIQGPAHQAGLLLEAGLVELLAQEVEGEPGALPLLSHALRTTWQRREGRTLTVAGYRNSGGIRDAVAQSAERLYDQLSPYQQRVLRDLLLRLVAPGPRGEPVRSPVARRTVATDPTHERLIEQLVSARLVTSDDGAIQLAHEALARAWPRLRDWLDDDIEGQRILRHLTGAADTWDAMGRPDSELYRGVRLTRALDWRHEAGPNLNPTEEAFLDASHALADSEQQAAEDRARHQTRVNRRLRALLVATAVFLVASIVVGAVAVGQRNRADRQRQVAERQGQVATARELAAAATDNIGVDPQLSALLALAAIDQTRSADGSVVPEAKQALYDAIIPYLGTTPPPQWPGGGAPLDWSPDGTHIAATRQDGTVDIRDAQSRQLVRSLHPHGAKVTGVAFSHDGSLLGTTTDDGFAEVFDVKTGKELHVLESPTGQPAWAPSFSPNGSLFAAAWSGRERILESEFVQIDNGFVRILDLTSGRIVQEIHRPPQRVPIRPTRSDAMVRDLGSVPIGLSFDPSGTRIVIASPAEPLLVVDVRTGDEVLTLGTPGPLPDQNQMTVGATAAEWSPDGASIAIGTPALSLLGVVDESSSDGPLIVTGPVGGGVFDARTGRPRFRFATGAEVEDLAFSADGSRLATTSTDGTVRIWDTDTGRQQLVLRSRDTPDRPGELAFRAGSIAFSPDGTELLVQASTNGPVWTWPLDLDEAIRFVKDTLTRTLTHQECQEYHIDPCP